MCLCKLQKKNLNQKKKAVVKKPIKKKPIKKKPKYCPITKDGMCGLEGGKKYCPKGEYCSEWSYCFPKDNVYGGMSASNKNKKYSVDICKKSLGQEEGLMLKSKAYELAQIGSKLENLSEMKNLDDNLKSVAQATANSIIMHTMLFQVENALSGVMYGRLLPQAGKYMSAAEVYNIASELSQA